MAVEGRRGRAAKGYQGGHAASASRNADCTTQGPADHALRVYLMRVSGQGSPVQTTSSSAAFPRGGRWSRERAGKQECALPTRVYTRIRGHICVSPEDCVRAQIRRPEPTTTNWVSASKTRASIPKDTAEYNRRELVAFCQGC